MRRAGIAISVFNFRGGGKPKNYLQAWRSLQAYLGKTNCDLVHVQFGQSGLLTLLSKQHPLVVTFQGSDLNGIVGPRGRLTLYGLMLRRLSQLVALRADEVIVVSEKLARHLPHRRYQVIPGGVDLDLFRPMPKQTARHMLNLPLDRQFVLFAGGRSNPIKRYSLAVQAVQQLQSHLNAELLLAERILPDQMPVYMNAADVLLLTSNREGSPNVVKEALACNLPVVSVDVGDVRERIGHIAGCFVCDNDRSQAISSALEKALTFGRPIEGRRAVEHLDGQLMAQQIIEVYRKAMAGQRSYPILQGNR